MIRKNIWKLLIGFLIIGVVLFFVLQPSPEIPPQIGAELPVPLAINVNGEELVFSYTDEIPRKDFDIFCTRENVKITWEAGYLECAFKNISGGDLSADLRALVSNSLIKLDKIERLKQDVVYFNEVPIYGTTTLSRTYIATSTSKKVTEFYEAEIQTGTKTVTSTRDEWQKLAFHSPTLKEISFKGDSFKSNKGTAYQIKAGETEIFKFWWTFPQGIKDEEILLAANDDFLDPTIDSSSWGCYYSIVPDAASTTGSQSNYPVLYNLTGKPTNIGSCDFKSDLSDIRFSTSVPDGGSIPILDHEIVFGTTTADNAQVFFRNVTFSSTSVVYVLMDNSGAVDISTTNTWRSEFKFVGHMEETAGSSIDSSQTGNTGTFVGSLPTATSSIIGDGQYFDGTGDYITWGDVMDYTGAYSISGWINIDVIGATNDFRFFGKWGSGGNQYQQYVYDGNRKLYSDHSSGGYKGGTVFNLDTWYYVAFVYNGSTGAIYVNGSDDTIDDTVGAPVNRSTPVYLGAKEAGGEESWGAMDEMRSYNGTLSAGWIANDYWSQVNNSAYWTAGIATTTVVVTRRIIIVD